MATNFTLLAGEIATALGHPGDVTAPVLGFAKGILEELTQNGSAGFSGGIPGPYSISGLTGPSMAAKVALYAGYPGTTPELIGFCTGVSTHIMTGIVTYVGPPPPASPNYFLGGLISGLNGAGMAAAVKTSTPFPSVTSQLLAMCSAVATHINSNASVVSGVIS